MRELKFHEKKLLKKVDFERYKNEDNFGNTIMRNYKISKRQEYSYYLNLTRKIQKLLHQLSELKPNDPFKNNMIEILLQKLHGMGVLSAPSLSELEKLNVTKFARRRLPVVMVRMKMAQTLEEANKFVRQVYVRVGPEVVKDPAFHVTRNMEDFITWTDTSKIKMNIMKYNDEVDDFDLLNC